MRSPIRLFLLYQFMPCFVYFFCWVFFYTMLKGIESLGLAFNVLLKIIL